jgi:hypothetical protein
VICLPVAWGDLLIASGLGSEACLAGGGEVQPPPLCGLGSGHCMQNICSNILVKIECPVFGEEIVKRFL